MVAVELPRLLLNQIFVGLLPVELWPQPTQLKAEDDVPVGVGGWQRYGREKHGRKAEVSNLGFDTVMNYQV